MIESEALADTASGELRPFLWEDGEMVDLGTLDGTGGYEWPGTVAWGINNRGQVVGWSRTEPGWIHAFLWEGAAV